MGVCAFNPSLEVPTIPAHSKLTNPREYNEILNLPKDKTGTIELYL